MIRFVPALPEDLELLFQLNRALIDQYEDIGSIDYDKVLLWVRKNIEQNLSHFSRILCNGKPAGFFCLAECDDRWELDSLFVLQPFQGQGIGTQVLRHCQSCCPSLMLYVFRKNIAAIRLYEKMGFAVTQAVGKTRYIMEWKNQD